MRQLIGTILMWFIKSTQNKELLENLKRLNDVEQDKRNI